MLWPVSANDGKSSLQRSFFHNHANHFSSSELDDTMKQNTGDAVAIMDACTYLDLENSNDLTIEAMHCLDVSFERTPTIVFSRLPIHRLGPIMHTTTG